MTNEYDIPVSFYIAEVVSVANSETYTTKLQQTSQQTSGSSLHHIYEINCKVVSPDPYSPLIRNIKPADLNTKKIPLVGEMVLIFQGHREDSNIEQLQPAWYYLTTLAPASNINSNLLTGLSKSGLTNTKPGETFIETDVPILQAYEGDVIVEGRWGNSIRFGSSIDTKKAVVDTLPNYLGDSGAPIILLSNQKTYSTKFVTENIESDASSLYLTSTQRINNLTTSNPVASDIAVSKFNRSQLIGVADRIVLKSKTDSVIVDGKQSIEINAPTIYLGAADRSNKEPMLHSTAVVSLLQKIVSMIKIGFADSSGVICTPLYDALIDAETLFQELTNDNILTDKYQKTNYRL
jgi:hypothetical protein